MKIPVSNDLAVLKSEVQHIRKSVDHLTRLLIEDENSLISRTEVLRTKMEKLEEKDKNFFQLKTAVISTVISAVMGFFLFLFDYLTRNQK